MTRCVDRFLRPAMRCLARGCGGGVVALAVTCATVACSHGSTAPSSTPSPSASPTAPASPAGGGTARIGDDFNGRALFPSDNWWNQDISAAPVDPQSAAFIDGIGRTRTAHPDFGPPPYGIPYVSVGGSEPRSAVAFVAYGDESDPGYGGQPGYPIPEAARTQPNYIEGGVPGGGSDGDRHLLVVDRERWILYELFSAAWNPGRQRWEAGSGAVFDLSSNARRPEGWTSADAAGLADPARTGPLR